MGISRRRRRVWLSTFSYTCKTMTVKSDWAATEKTSRILGTASSLCIILHYQKTSL